MFRKKIRNGGFVLVEFAIALPLLILVMYGLAIVSMKIFLLGKEQLADYVLEAEAQYVMERIIHLTRAAKEIVAYNKHNKIKIVYHAVDDWKEGDGYFFETLKDAENKKYYLFGDRDVLETQFIFPYPKEGRNYSNLYATRRDDTGAPSNPITGENFFGETKLNSLQFSELNKNVLRIELEMESLMTGHKIKIATAVFMPSCESFEIKNE